MEKRKVMQLGRSSLVISLPKTWIDQNHIEHGNFVSVEIQPDRSLTVYPKYVETNNIKTITLYVDIEEDKDSISRSIISCYLNGYSSINLISRKFFTAAQQRAIRRISRILYLRIMEADTKNINLTTLAEESKTTIFSNIDKMNKIVISMCRDVLLALQNNDKELARTVFNLDDDVDQFCYFVLRLLRKSLDEPSLLKQLEINAIDSLDYQILVNRVESIGDLATNISRQIILLSGENLQIPDEITKLIIESGKKVINAYETAINSFLSKDVSPCNDIINEQKEIKNLDTEIAKNSFLHPGMTPMTICSVCTIRDSIVRIHDWAVTIANSSIMRAYSS